MQDPQKLRVIMEQYKQLTDQNRPAAEILANLNGCLESRNRSSLMAALRDSSIYLQNGTLECVQL